MVVTENEVSDIEAVVSGNEISDSGVSAVTVEPV